MIAQLLQALQIGHQHFAEMLRFSNADGTIRLAVESFPDNVDLRHVTLKAALVNTLYRTSIFDVPRIAQHILDRSIDEKLDRRDLSVVDDIRLGHGIGTDTTERNLYSFATKYVHFHRPDAYPLFDNLVKALLPELNKDLCFMRRFTQKQLVEYTTYKGVIDALMTFLGCDDWGYKRFDEGLWVMARFKKERGFDRNRIPAEVFEQLRDAIREVGKQSPQHTPKGKRTRPQDLLRRDIG